MNRLDYRCDALISPCGLYRYWLSREWDADLPRACWVLLNPSTADAVEDDPTIRRCVSFARGWGCGSIVVVNLFALRATDPRQLKQAIDPVGPENDGTIFHQAYGRMIVAGWGAHGGLHGRDRKVMELLKGAHQRPMCLGTTKDGSPRHPLYVASATNLQPFGREPVQ
jgi:hypothetical protein